MNNQFAFVPGDDGRFMLYTPFWVYTREVDGSVHVEPSSPILALQALGRWARRVFVPRFIGCSHEIVRCVHGDEIIFAAGGRRRACAWCGSYLKGDLPDICSATGKAHGS